MWPRTSSLLRTLLSAIPMRTDVCRRAKLRCACRVHRPASGKRAMARNDEQGVGINRRVFLGTVAVASTGLSMRARADEAPPGAKTASGEPHTRRVTLQINGAPHELVVDTRTTLLDALRNHLQ